MSTEESGYMMIARANVQHGDRTTATVVKELLAHIDRLEAQLARPPKALDFPHLIEIRTETYAAGTHRVLTLINEYINSGAMAVVSVQAQREP